MDADTGLRFVPPGAAEVEWVRDSKHEWLVRNGLTGPGELAMVRVTMKPGQSHAFHCHPRMEEILYYVSGRGIQWVGEEKSEMGAGDTAHIPMGEVHATYNPFDEPLVFLAILTPAVFDGNETRDLAEEEPWASMGGV
ncbi:MAG: cupin [Planctomycetes bacterium]|nr:cupin [Planctomycetota bacterium]HJM56636.1 cupin domain-containing protein [Planctomycetota bacterium]